MLDRLNSKGFAIIRNRTRKEILDLGSSLGNPISEPRDGILIKELRPFEAESALKNTLSAEYGAGAFPFHTEAAYWPNPPRYLILYCDNPGSGQRPTLLVDGSELEAGSDSTILKHIPWLIYRIHRPFYASVLEATADRVRVRLDQQCMRPVHKTDVTERLNMFLEGAKRVTIDWSEGDLVVIDNWRMLHARGAATRGDSDRRLLKLLVENRRVH